MIYTICFQRTYRRSRMAALRIIAVTLLVWGSGNVLAQEIRPPGLVQDSILVLDEIKKSREVYRQQREGRPEYEHARNAINAALALNDTLLYARALDNLGLLYRYHQQYGDAIALHSKAYELVEQLAVPPVFKMIFANNTGVAARYFEKYDSAVLYYLTALRIAEQEDDLKNIAIASNGLGNALGYLPGRQEEALAFLNRALEVEKLRNNTLGMAMNYLSISDYYIQKKDYATARTYLQKLKRLNQARNDDHGLAITDEFYGLSYLKEGKDYDRAAAYFNMSLQRFRKLKDRQKEAEILASLARVRDKQHRRQDALHYYEASMEIARETNSKSLIMQNANDLATLYENGHDLQRALKYYQMAQLYKDSINLSEQQVKIAALTTSYDIEKKEARIELLENEKQLRKEQLVAQQEKIRRQQIMFLLIVVMIVAILTIILLQNRASKNRKRAAIQLARQEKERLQAVYDRDLAEAKMLVSRLQINPHFLFNCLNAINYMIQKGENEKANKYLIVFSRFVRMVLESSEEDVVPLTEELELIRHYLTLEQHRFAQNFTYDISISDKERAAEVMIPPLLLQPFVENAVLHGLMNSKKAEKKVEISVEFDDGGTEIVIDDNGIGYRQKKFAPGGSQHKSMGMKITRERIDLFNKHYETQLDFEIMEKPQEHDGGTRVILNLQPQEDLAPAN